jgi:hypothetical protein
MNNATTIVRRTPQTLASTIAGDVFVPGDSGYEGLVCRAGDRAVGAVA